MGPASFPNDAWITCQGDCNPSSNGARPYAAGTPEVDPMLQIAATPRYCKYKERRGQDGNGYGRNSYDTRCLQSQIQSTGAQLANGGTVALNLIRTSDPINPE